MATKAELEVQLEELSERASKLESEANARDKYIAQLEAVEKQDCSELAKENRLMKRQLGIEVPAKERAIDR